MEKLISLQDAMEIVQKYQENKQKVVMANGCFDLLHVGHIRYLQSARKEGNLLLVAVNSDQSVKQNKGPGRPLMPALERAEILSALSVVDYVFIFNELTLDNVLKRLKPDIHAKGTDYTEKSVPERKTVLDYGGKIAIVGDPKNHSTRNYLDQIKMMSES